jgi:hypothetical protein
MTNSSGIEEYGIKQVLVGIAPSIQSLTTVEEEGDINGFLPALLAKFKKFFDKGFERPSTVL